MDAHAPVPSPASPDPPRLVLAITGPHGAGKSKHAAALALELSRRGVGVSLLVHPPLPEGLGSWARALHYASARAQLLAADAARVLVADRWTESTILASEWAPRETGQDMRLLARLEDRQLGVVVHHLVLDAPDAELDARLARRHGRPQTEAERAEALFLRRRFGGAPRILTDRAEAEVARDVLAWAEDVLGIAPETST